MPNLQARGPGAVFRLPLPPDLTGLVQPARNLRPRRPSSWDLRDTQAPTPRQSNSPGRRPYASPGAKRMSKSDWLFYWSTKHTKKLCLISFARIPRSSRERNCVARSPFTN